MLLPQQSAASQQEQSLPLSNRQHNAIAEGISEALKHGLDRVISANKVFNDCTLVLCGESSLQAALESIAQGAPEVDIVLLYTLSQSSRGASLQVSLIDPLSFQEYDQVNVNILRGDESQIEETKLRSLANDIGTVIGQRLVSLQKQQAFSLQLSGFTLEEISPLSSFVLTESRSSKLRLLKSEKMDTRFADYLPIMTTRFSVSTTLTQSQFNQLLLAYFDASDISIVSEYQRSKNTFLITRIGNPYTPSFVSTLFSFSLFLIVFSLLIKRQVFHYQLERHAEKKAVDQWLAVYEQAKAPWLLLRSKWGNQYNYWQRLQRESQELEKQAKLLFEAGDVTSAKLFISKALNINSNAELARQLVNKIEQQENSQKALSEKEQQVRNKVAKAMNNYRAKQPVKALRQAYQALGLCEGDKQLKRQHKAIKRLIQKICKEYTQPIFSIALNDLKTDETCTVSAEESVDIGRALPAQSVTLADFHGNDQSGGEQQGYIQTPNMFFCINHKALSRVGKHCRLQQEENGFSLQDLGSTNGSFLRSIALQPNQKEALQDQDIIYLGASSELTAVKLKVSMDEQATIAQFYIERQLQHTLDATDLARVWPDYMHAMRASLVLTKQSIVLAMDETKSRLRVISEHHCKHHEGYMPLIKISFGEECSIEPLLLPSQNQDSDDKAIKAALVQYNNEVLLGRIPLVLPCEIKWQEQHVYIDECHNAAPRNTRFAKDRFQLQYQQQPRAASEH